MNTQTLSYKTLKNISYSFIGSVFPIVFAIFITPIIVAKLGVESYGLYILVNTVVSLMGLFDLGVGQILVKYISEYTASKNEKRLQDLMYSFNTVLAGIGVLGLVILSLVGILGNRLFPSEAISSEYYSLTFFIAGLTFLVNTISALYTTSQVAMQRYDVYTKIGMSSLAFSSVGSLIVVLLGYNVESIFLIQLASSLLFVFVSRYYTQQFFPLAKLKFWWVKAEVIKSYKFGFAAYLSNVANSALTYFDRLIIPVFLGPAALPYYSLPGSVASKTPSVIGSLAGVLFPMISAFNGINDLNKIRAIYIRAFRLITTVSFAITTSIILFAYEILQYWLDFDFADKSTHILVILAATYYFLSLSGTLNNFLLGMGKAKLLFKASLGMATLNVVLLLALLPKFGVLGAAWAYLLSVTPVIYMLYYVEKYFLHLDNQLIFYGKLYGKNFVTAGLFYGVSKYITLPFVRDLKALLVLGPLSVFIYLAIYRYLGFFDREDLETLRSFKSVVFKKFKFKNI